jgi:excisionase family DNA binding protein
MNCLIRPMPPVPADLERATRLYSRLETAKLLKCSVPTVDRLIKEGAIAPTRIGGRIFFSIDSIMAFCAPTAAKVAA